jgi:hypothetical protein
MQLTEENALEILAKPRSETLRPAGPIAAWQPLLRTPDELAWISDSALVASRSRNQFIELIGGADEATVLSHPDVIAAIDAALPDIDAWGNTL